MGAAVDAVHAAPHTVKEVIQMRSYAVIGLLALLLLGCVSQPPSANQSGGPPIINANGSHPAGNQTVQPTALPPDYTVSLGDTVWINYTVWVKDKVYDTNNATLANQSGLYDPRRSYEPINFTVQFQGNIINGMVSSVIGMKVNETLDFDVAPADGYGPYDSRKVIVVPRYFNMSLEQVVPRSYFEQRNLTIVNGTGFDDPQFGQVFISDLNDQNVTVFLLGIAATGTKFMFDNMPQETVFVGNKTATIERLFELNHTYIIPDPHTGAPTYFKTIGVSNDSITLDGNHPLANETLHFRVTMLKIQKGNLSIGSIG